ncbi:MAG TPA: response regulator transcription factor [Flavipsychrobacter sp.]|nr:response regulator transcription factor [Flavipsychrobacter sp.]
MSIKLVITDDHPLMINALQNIINSNPDFKLCGAYTTGMSLLAGLTQSTPDVLLLDIQLPDKMGNELVRTISKKYPKIAILALTSLDSLFYVRDMMQHGCMGYLTKNTDETTLATAIRTVYNGDQYLEEGIKQQLVSNIFQKKAQSKATPLTEREKEILQLIALEHTNQQIADKLFIALRTVENHRMNITQKLKCKNSVGLIKTALQMGLID